MIKLRLKRMGAKKRPSYRIVVADSRSPRDGRFIENLGYYDPLTDPATVKVDAERARYWIGVGGQPTDTVRYLLKTQGIVGEDGRVVAPASEAESTEAVAAAS